MKKWKNHNNYIKYVYKKKLKLEYYLSTVLI